MHHANPSPAKHFARRAQTLMLYSTKVPGVTFSPTLCQKEHQTIAAWMSEMEMPASSAPDGLIVEPNRETSCALCLPLK